MTHEYPQYLIVSHGANYTVMQRHPGRIIPPGYAPIASGFKDRRSAARKLRQLETSDLKERHADHN